MVNVVSMALKVRSRYNIKNCDHLGAFKTRLLKITIASIVFVASDAQVLVVYCTASRVSVR